MCAATLGLAACGGQTKTVTETVGSTSPPAATTTEPAAPTGATGTTERAPSQPLPTSTGGAAVVQGTYRMRVSSSQTPVEYEKGDELTWGAVTRCEQECVVELNRENTNGGFTRLELKPISPTQYGRDGTGTVDCGPLGDVVPSTTRTSVSVLKVRDEGDIQLATEIQGFIRNRYDCAVGSEKVEVVRFRGRLEG